MIEDIISMNQLSKRDRRKKRKKDSIVLRTSSIKETNGSGNRDFINIPTLPSRSSSANDALYTISHIDNGVYSAYGSHTNERPGSAPDNSIDYFSNSLKKEQVEYDRKVQILTMEAEHDQSSNSNDIMLLHSETLDSSALEDDAFLQVKII
jgi:hypothetical protein